MTSSAAPSAAATVAVTLDASATYQIINGFGSSSRLFDEPHLFADKVDPATGRALPRLNQADYDEIMDLLYLDLGLTRIRPLIANGIEEVNDNEDPYVTDLSAFDFEWKNGDGHIDYVNAALERGAHTFFLSPLRSESFFTRTNPEEYVEWAMAILNHWRDAGLELPFYAIFNEPGFRGGIRSAEHIRDVIKLLGAEMRAQGFETMIVAADDINTGAALGHSRIVLADPEARQYIGAVAFHIYGDYRNGELLDRGLSELKALAESHGLPLWMSEFAGIPEGWEWGLLMHDLLANYNVAAVDLLFGAFGQQAGGSTYVRLLSDGATYLGPEPTTKYYYAGQYARFVTRGARRIDATSTDPALKVSAYANLNGEIVIVAINTSDGDIAGAFRIENAPEIGSARAIRTSDTESWADLPAPAITPNSLSASLPGRSFTTFVLPEPGRFARHMSAIAVLVFLRRRAARARTWR